MIISILAFLFCGVIILSGGIFACAAVWNIGMAILAWKIAKKVSQ